MGKIDLSGTLKKVEWLLDRDPPIMPLAGDKEVGYCHERCPSHDGKRCEHLGHRAPTYHICPFWAEWAAEEIKRLEEEIQGMDEDAAEEDI